MSEPPSQSQDKFIVRLPDGMRERIKAAADLNRRSMNAEIVDRLEKSFSMHGEKETLLTELADIASSGSEKDLKNTMVDVLEAFMASWDRRHNRP